MDIATVSGTRGLRITAATSRATTIAIVPGPHNVNFENSSVRSASNKSAGKNPAMKNTPA